MPAPRPPAIRATGLRKSFGALTVLDGIDLTVPAGTVLALLGPNGAGKTTTVNILSTLVRADAGTARGGRATTSRTSPDAVRSAIGVTGQFSAVDTLLTAEENLRLMADLHHLPRVEGRARADALLERFELSDAAHKPVAGFSGGMQRKLDLAMTLDGRPVGDLPRRADDGPRPAQPARDVGRRPRPGRRRGDGPAHDPVPRGGRPAGRTSSRSWTADGSSRRARRPS